MKETRDGEMLYIDVEPGEKIEGPRELNGPLVIRSAEGSFFEITGPATLQGPMAINGCRLEGLLVVPKGVTVRFAPS